MVSCCKELIITVCACFCHFALLDSSINLHIIILKRFIPRSFVPVIKVIYFKLCIREIVYHISTSLFVQRIKRGGR